MKRCWVLNGFGKARVRAAAEGAKRMGYEVERVSSGVAMKIAVEGAPDFAIGSGDPCEEKPGREALNAAGCRVLVLDLGYLRRASGPRDETGYNQAGWDGLCRPPARSGGPERLASLGIAAKERGKVRGPWLVCGQCAGDTQHHLSEEVLARWLRGAAATVKSRDGFVWRAHPAQASTARPDDRWLRQCSARVPLAEALRTVAGMVTFNSTAGVEAIVEGVPVVCAATAHYAEVSQGTRAERQEYLERLAWGQWTCEELRSGEALEWLIGNLKDES